MNDYEEVRFGVNEGRAIFEALPSMCAPFCSTELLSRIAENFNRHLKVLEDEHALDIYVLCFSEHQRDDADGKLSMWRGYGARGNGAALILDGETLSTPDNEHPVLITKIGYGSRNQRREVLRDRLLKWANVCRSLDLTAELADFAALVAFQLVLLLSLSWKHDGFKEEDEWRAIYFAPLDSNQLLHKYLSYSVTAAGIVPRFKFRVEPISPTSNQKITIDHLLHSILLGPATSSELSVATVKRMLKELLKPHLADRVKASGIPFREKLG